MQRPDPLIWMTAVIASITSGVTWSIWVASQAPGALVIAISVQIMAGLVGALVAAPERRTLAAALAGVVPVIGPLAGAWAADARGRGGAELLPAPDGAAHVDGLAIARRLTTSLPSCEALVSNDLEARRATIARLARRATADDIAMLLWARSHPDPDVAVEIALALEEVGQRFEQRVHAARAAALANPCFATHAAVVRVISAGILTGVIDGPLVRVLVDEARTHHAEAIALEPARAAELVAVSARLELVMGRPAVACDLIAGVVWTSVDDELIALHGEAAYAARRFDLAPGLARRRASRALA